MGNNCNNKVSREELEMLQSLPLDIKIAKTKLRIREWVRHYGIEGVYVSFSGGKDSTVLLDIARQEFPDIKAVFIDTGLEYPELKEHVKSFDNVEIVRPRRSFKQIIDKFGYPVISKEQSRYIYDIRNSTEKMRNRRLYGDKNGRYKLSKKWHFMLDAPFKISANCCDAMKKNPIKSYEHRTGRVPILGTMAAESGLRMGKYLKQGCNAFENTRPMSTPMGFWTEQDVLEYIYNTGISIPSVYGKVVKTDNGYNTTGVNRTGCIFCLYGIQYDTGYNRIQKLQVTHPKLHRYIIDKLHYDEVMSYMGIPYEIPDDELNAAIPVVLSEIGNAAEGCSNNCTCCNLSCSGINLVK